MAGVMVGLFPLSKALLNVPSTIFIEKFSIRSYFLLTCTFQVVGSILYALANIIGFYEVALVGRLLVGALGGQLLNGSFVARGYNANLRSSAMLMMQNAQVSAYVLGPLLGGLLTYACEEAEWTGQLINKDTVPGWFMCLASFVLFLVAACLFEEPPSPPKRQASSDGGSVNESKVPWHRLIIAYVVVFIVPTIIGSWEVHTIDFAKSAWGWSTLEAGCYLAAIMFVGIPATLYGSKIAKKLSDRFAIFLMVMCLLPFPILFIPPVAGPMERRSARLSCSPLDLWDL